MEKKLETSKKIRKELEEDMEMMKIVLEDKEKEINDAKDQLHQAKEAVIREYRDFDALLEELETSYADNFDDVVCQVKKAYHDLDFSQLNINAQAQATAQPDAFKSTEDLFANDVAFCDEKSALVENQAQLVSLRVFKRMLKTPPSSLIFFFLGGNCNYLGNRVLIYPSFLACKTFPLRALSNIYLFYCMSIFMILNIQYVINKKPSFRWIRPLMNA